MSQRIPEFVSRTHIYIVESDESHVQIFVHLNAAMNCGKERDFDDETNVTITDMCGPVDLNGELRVFRIWSYVGESKEGHIVHSEWKREEGDRVKNV